MADLLLANHDMSKVPSTIGTNWVNKFIQRHNMLKTCFSQRHNHEWALCEDTQKIKKWFKLVQQTIEEWGIVQEDIYNFDETSFAIGMIATAKVITQANRQSHPSLIQSGNQEWVTVIKTINTAGWVLPSMIIFASKTHCTN